MFQQIINYLNELSINHEVIKFENHKYIGLNMETYHTTYKCVIDVREEQCFFLFYSIITDFFVPEHKRTEISILLNRINHELMIGNFEMDSRDGEIRYKTSIDYEGLNLKNQTIYNIIFGNLKVIDEFYPSIRDRTFVTKGKKK